MGNWQIQISSPKAMSILRANMGLSAGSTGMLAILPRPRGAISELTLIFYPLEDTLIWCPKYITYPFLPAHHWWQLHHWGHHHSLSTLKISRNHPWISSAHSADILWAGMSCQCHLVRSLSISQDPEATHAHANVQCPLCSGNIAKLKRKEVDTMKELKLFSPSCFPSETVNTVYPLWTSQNPKQTTSLSCEKSPHHFACEFFTPSPISCLPEYLLLSSQDSHTTRLPSFLSHKAPAIWDAPVLGKQVVLSLIDILRA